jgi:LemA protein
VIVLWIVLGIIVVIGIALVVSYNRFVSQRNLIRNSWANIDTELRRRYDLIPNLVETVRGYAEHEREVFEDVTRARAGAEAASGVQDQAKAENELTAGIRRLIAVAENYPQLKANENFLALQEELTGTESKIAFARQFYNDQVMHLNTLIQSFPSRIVAGLGHFQPREFFDIEDPARGPVAVRF